MQPTPPRSRRHRCRLRRAALLLVVQLGSACEGDRTSAAPSARPPPVIEPAVLARTEPGGATAQEIETSPPPPLAVKPARYGAADLDPHNDSEVGPPMVVPDCGRRLAELGVSFRTAELPLKQKRGEVFTCGAEQAVIYLSGPTAARFSPRPVLSCHMALAVARFERVLEQHAERHFGSVVRRIHQMGTYSCRKMAAFPSLVSEHSYANAIDVDRFTLRDGREIRVASHFGPLGALPADARGRFLRELARQLYDEDVFSVVLTPYFNRDHRDHFHLDLARYRVDGTRL